MLVLLLGCCSARCVYTQQLSGRLLRARPFVGAAAAAADADDAAAQGLLSCASAAAKQCKGHVCEETMSHTTTCYADSMYAICLLLLCAGPVCCCCCHCCCGKDSRTSACKQTQSVKQQLRAYLEGTDAGTCGSNSLLMSIAAAHSSQK